MQLLYCARQASLQPWLTEGFLYEEQLEESLEVYNLKQLPAW